jgi:hypothetical protein
MQTLVPVVARLDRCNASMLGRRLGLTQHPPAEADLDRRIALEANQDWSGALDACANASRVAPDSNAGRLASGKTALLREMLRGLRLRNGGMSSVLR